MINKQDSYWTEYTLDEKVDQKVCVYLREHHAEYRNTKQKMKELMEQYPNVQAVFETGDAVTLTAEEHEILHTQTSHIKNGLRTLKNQYFNPQHSNHAALCPYFNASCIYFGSLCIKLAVNFSSSCSVIWKYSITESIRAFMMICID